MARKNNGIQGMSFEQILQQQVQKSVEEPVYCRFCGRNIKEPSNKSPGGSMGAWRSSLEWEIANKSHASCAREHMGRR